jgi:hypothetical protein
MKKALWLHLRDYHFTDLVPTNMWSVVAEAFGGTDASERAFANKIAHKHAWSSRFALRAITEYRKFVFLGVSGDTVVTPSKVIDTVWHEHLLFTRGYRDFCRNVLGRDFDHHPELLPTDKQTDLFAQQYNATLARYRTEFRVEPPVDIWGTPKFTRTNEQRARDEHAAIGGGGDVPLYAQFDGRDNTPWHHDMPEFNADGGGGFAGGGGGTDWSGDSSGDAIGSDAGSGGSGCSSGCGGD